MQSDIIGIRSCMSSENASSCRFASGYVSETLPVLRSSLLNGNLRGRSSYGLKSRFLQGCSQGSKLGEIEKYRETKRANHSV